MGILLAALKREYRSLRSNPRNLIVLGGTPIFFMLLFGYLYSAHVVNSIPMTILDYSHTQTSRQLINAFTDSDKFKLVGRVESENELRQSIEAGDALAALVIPPDFQKQLRKLRTTPIMLVVNGSNMVISNSVIASASEIVTTMSMGSAIKVMEAKGMLPGAAKNTATLISFRPRIWYNPTFNYSNFLLLGLLGAAAQQVILLFTAVSLVGVKKDKLLRRLSRSKVRLALYVGGKALFYVLTTLLTMNISLLLLTYGFGVPMHGYLLGLFLLEISFSAGVAALGIFLSVISKNPLEATQTAMLVAVPSFLLSGYTWPIQAMPPPLQILSKLLPLTYFVDALRKVAVMGVGIEIIAKDIMFLGLLAVILIPVSIFALRYQITQGSINTNQPHNVLNDVN